MGVPANRVVVRVKRMGGGFGGKESRTTMLSTVVAVAANKYVRRRLASFLCLCLFFKLPRKSSLDLKLFPCVRLKRPVRCMLDRDEDMLITGGRHPFYGKYTVRERPLLGRTLSTVAVASVLAVIAALEVSHTSVFRGGNLSNSSTISGFLFVSSLRFLSLTASCCV